MTHPRTQDWAKKIGNFFFALILASFLSLFRPSITLTHDSVIDPATYSIAANLFPSSSTISKKEKKAPASAAKDFKKTELQMETWRGKSFKFKVAFVSQAAMGMSELPGG